MGVLIVIASHTQAAPTLTTMPNVPPTQPIPTPTVSSSAAVSAATATGSEAPVVPKSAVTTPRVLGALIQSVQSSIPEVFSSPDTRNLPMYEPRQVVVSWVEAQQAQVLELLGASQGKLVKIIALPNLALNIAVLAFDTQQQADTALASLLSATPTVTADKLAVLYSMQADSANPRLPVSGARQYALGMV